MDEKTKAIIEQSEGVMEEIYKDLVSPSVKPVGTMLSLLPRTIRLGLCKWEKWIINGEESLRLTAEALREKVARIPEAKQCEPEPYIAVPAIQQISYCYDSKELRELYANLLAASMNVDTKAAVHPSFVDIIKQLTPDEAKLIAQLPKTTNGNLPIVDLVIKEKDTHEKRTIARNIMHPYYYGVCDNPDNMSSYIENLERLKLISLPRGIIIPREEVYKQIEESEFIEKEKIYILPKEESYEIEKRLLFVTDYGVQFIKCCIEPIEEVDFTK